MLGARLSAPTPLHHQCEGRPPSRPAARRALPNRAVASAAGWERLRARYPIYTISIGAELAQHVARDLLDEGIARGEAVGPLGGAAIENLAFPAGERRHHRMAAQ